MRNSGKLSWVLIPAAITLAIVLIRLWGELSGWSPEWFSTAAGGGTTAMSKDTPQPTPSLFGIFWLMPIFGIYFAAKLKRSGAGPENLGKAFLFTLIGIVLFGGTAGYFFGQIQEAMKPGAKPPAALPYMGYVIAAVGWTAVILAARGWGALIKLQVFYGLLARIPIVILTVILIPMNKGTHFEKLPPFAGEMNDADRTWFLCLPQIGFWVPLTVLGGALAGLLVSLVIPAGRGDDI